MEQCVLFDKLESNPSYRYKMTFDCPPCAKGCFGPRIDRLCIATSPDGITWKDHGKKFEGWTDTQPCLYHDFEGKGYDLILRYNYPTAQYDRGIRGTQIRHLDEEAFSQLLTSNMQMPFKMVNNWYFDQYGKNERYQRQTYAFTRTLYEGVYLALNLLY